MPDAIPVLRPPPAGPTGPEGDEGPSAYEVAVADGFIGNEAAWLASLVGSQGPQGENGTPGGSFEHDQLVAATTWGPIVHNLGLYPAVSVVDSAGTAVTGAVTYHDRNSLSITFSVPFAGTASLT